ncbi:MAG TPA: CBO0543 family protein [Clostridia bacterium]|nr:CBO0543 family protein [Clostridia bacterium]
MILNFVLFFIIPLVFSIFLYHKSSVIYLTGFCFSCLLAFTFNTLGVYFGFWNVYPYNLSYFSYLPLNMGLYPAMGTFYLYLLHVVKFHKAILLLSFAIISTAFKAVLIYSGRAVYGNGWNTFYTFISFAIMYYFGYLFYTVLSRKKVIV